MSFTLSSSVHWKYLFEVPDRFHVYSCCFVPAVSVFCGLFSAAQQDLLIMLLLLLFYASLVCMFPRCWICWACVFILTFLFSYLWHYVDLEGTAFEAKLCHNSVDHNLECRYRENLKPHHIHYVYACGTDGHWTLTWLQHAQKMHWILCSPLHLKSGSTDPTKFRFAVIWKTGRKSNIYANKYGQHKTANLVDNY
jgi:hypothetical protein